MSKTKLAPTEIDRIIKDYFQAVKLAISRQAMDQTDLTYRRGWFYLRPLGYSREVPGIPYRAHQVEDMTRKLRKRIPQRTDSDSDGYPD